jgi:FKBP-type peptidyl-prolyl cis-trans isomerase SlyD
MSSLENPVKIADNRVVAIDYTLTDDEQNELDSSSGREPLKYLHGAQNIIPGLEKALAGKAEGDEVQVTVQPEEAYGPVNPDLIQKAPLSAFQGVEEVKPGMQFQAEGPNGQTQIITVREVHDDGVDIDANHPLAGQVLHFDVKIQEVREATDEEVEHGHVH